MSWVQNILGKPPWRSQPLIVAATVALLGTVLWVVPMAQGSEFPPVLVRLGLSFIGGFFVGWTFRKSVKIFLLLTAAAMVAIFVLQMTDVINLDWASMLNESHGGINWIRGQANLLKDVLVGYLPSGAAAITGIFIGARHR